MSAQKQEESDSDSYSSGESIESVDFYDILPPEVKRRINALKKLQLEKDRIYGEFFDEIHKLEKKYENIYDPVFRKRNQIVTGVYEPKDSDLSSNESEDKQNKEITVQKASDDIKGVPEFWLNALKCCPNISDLIEEYDEPILKHLIDIRIIRSIDPKKISLEFTFSSNEYFSNEVLVKEFSLFTNTEINQILVPINCSGSKIDWKKGKDVTIDYAKKGKGKKSVHKKSSAKQSFFNFFSRPQVKKNQDEIEDNLSKDWAIAQELYLNVVPNAVLFYTGEVYEDSDDDEEEDDYEENDSSDSQSNDDQ